MLHLSGGRTVIALEVDKEPDEPASMPFFFENVKIGAKASLLCVNTSMMFVTSSQSGAQFEKHVAQALHTLDKVDRILRHFLVLCMPFVVNLAVVRVPVGLFGQMAGALRRAVSAG